MFSWRLHASGQCYAPHTDCLPCNTCTVTMEIWVMNVLTMPLHLGYLDLLTSSHNVAPPAGLFLNLMLSCDLTAVRTLLELMQSRFLEIEVSVVFTIGLCLLCISRALFWCYLCSCSQPSLFSRRSNGMLFFICSIVFAIGFIVLYVHFTRTFGCFACLLLPVDSCIPKHVMESLSSSISTVPSCRRLFRTPHVEPSVGVGNSRAG